jgi:multidrug efflux system outer membrane protein
MKQFWLITLLLLITACGSDHKRDANKDLPIPEVYDSARVRGEIQENWLQSFKDPQLEKLVKAALENNKDLRASYYKLRSAEHQARLAGAELWPKFSAGAQESRELFNSVRSEGSDSANNAFFDSVKGRRRITGVSLNVSWELDLWGRLRASKDSLQQEFVASLSDYAGAQLSLVAQVSKAYFSVLEAGQQLAIAEELFSFQKEKTKLLDKRYSRGLIPSNLLRLARAELLSLDVAFESQKKANDQLSRQLEILLGNYPHLKKLKKSAFPKLVAEVPAGLPSELLARRPDISAARHRLLAAGYQIKKSRAELLPQFSLTASGGGRSHDFKYISNPGSRIWNLVGNLTQPIFEGGRLKEQLRYSKKQEAMIFAQYESQVLKAFSEVEVALAGDEFLWAIEKKRKLDLNEFEAIQSRAQSQFEKGLKGLGDLTEDKKNTLNKKSLWIKAKRERLENRIDLFLALGGGWSQ